MTQPRQAMQAALPARSGSPDLRRPHPRRSRTRTMPTEPATGPSRIGTLRKFCRSLALYLQQDADGARHFDLAVIAPRQTPKPLGTVTLCPGGEPIPDWTDFATAIGCTPASPFARSVLRAVCAVSAGIDGQTVPVEHGLRLDSVWAGRITLDETGALA